MTITSAANHYRKILSELIDNCPSFASFLNASRKAIEDNRVTYDSYDSYYDFYSDDQMEEDLDICLDELNDYSRDNFNSKIIFRHGSFRVVIIDEDSDYVLKFSFSRSSHCYENNTYDDCQTEEETYQIAIDNGVENDFAEVISIGSFEHKFTKTPILFLAKKMKVDTFNPNFNYDFEKFCNTNGINAEDILDIVTHSFACVFSSYYRNDPASFIRLVNFIRDFNITDLHMENIGFVEDKPYIIDYGFASTNKIY